MILPISSAITSGIFSALEFSVYSLLVFLIFRISRYHNLHVLYQLRQPLHLYSTRLAIFSPSPLTSPLLSRISTVVLILVLSLFTLASFAFVGESQPYYQTKTVPLLLTKASNKFLDYRLHLSSNGRFASAVFLYLFRNFCHSGNGGLTVLYASFVDLPGDIDEVKWPLLSTKISNFTCVTQENGFRNMQILNVESSNQTVFDLSLFCGLPLNLKELPPKFSGEVKLSPNISILSPGCTGRQHSMHCSLHIQKTCVLTLNMTNYFTILFTWEDERHGLQKAGDGFKTEKPLPSLALSSLAYLSDVLQDRHLAREMIHLTVKRNGQVQADDGFKRVTVVNMRWLLSTGGIGLLICLFVLLWEVRAWCVVGRGREKYNGFCSLDDAEACLRMEMIRRYGLHDSERIWRCNGELKFWNIGTLNKVCTQLSSGDFSSAKFKKENS